MKIIDMGLYPTLSLYDLLYRKDIKKLIEGKILYSYKEFTFRYDKLFEAMDSENANSVEMLVCNGKYRIKISLLYHLDNYLIHVRLLQYKRVKFSLMVKCGEFEEGKYYSIEDYNSKWSPVQIYPNVQKLQSAYRLAKSKGLFIDIGFVKSYGGYLEFDVFKNNNLYGSIVVTNDYKPKIKPKVVEVGEVV